jgi:FtsP/CotA-like multicopper oxidase with cupredoxin domain
MGVVVEYAGSTGDPQWAPADSVYLGPPALYPARRDHTPPDHTIELLIGKRNAEHDGFKVWTLSGSPFDMRSGTPQFELNRGGRYRLRLRNATDDIHPIHLHRHAFEITHIAATPTAGLRKDVAMVGGYQAD